uniref:Uncharacterized protein LOC100368541 n=1 Tax=Saccoglossus kowalevskii TaxID=10224 RepID=A0ABM0MVD1_SACKO|nr:PREDICTED: uncharacterized protein LOC100368541 [Saccoglossus kowalevskii]
MSIVCESQKLIHTNCQSSNQAKPRDMHIDWTKAKPHNLINYIKHTELYLETIDITEEAICCSDISCKDSNHCSDINRFYKEIVAALNKSEHLSFKVKSTVSFVPVPDWNDLVKDAHDMARECFLVWRDAGKPRQGFIHHMIQSSRSKFKLALRSYRKNEAQARADSIAKSFINKECSAFFWKKVHTKKRGTSPSTVGGTSGEPEIADMWADHFEAILNSVKHDQYKANVHNYISDCDNNDILVSSADIANIIGKLPTQKSRDSGGLSAENLMYANSSVNVHLSMCISSMFVHGYIPTDKSNVTLLLQLKNKNGDVTSKNNYHPIAITTVISKLVEHLLLERCELYLMTTSNQFGFKKNHSPVLCVFDLKELIRHYNSLGSNVFVCFLDASKAFDKVNHWTLFSKLVDRKVSPYIVRFLVNWYSSQNYSITDGIILSGDYSLYLMGCDKGVLVASLIQCVCG